MSNTIYIDANRANGTSGATTTNEWVSKLNTELLLPKGTNIQIQNSFINKQGITGGSIEIEEDIYETIVYYFYITETPQWSPVAHKTDDTDSNNPWYRGTLQIKPDNFMNNFIENDPTSGVLQISQDEQKSLMLDNGMITVAEQKTGYFDYFRAFGGSSMILPAVKVMKDTSDNHPYVQTDVRTLRIKIPMGVYGIGQLAQLIEDQINGVSYLNGNEIIKKDTNKIQFQDDTWDGQPSNTPILTRVNTQLRGFDNITAVPYDAQGEEGNIFLNQKDFNDLIEYEKTNGPTPGQSQFKYQEYINTHAVYTMMTNFADGSGGEVADPDITVRDYGLYSYEPRSGSGVLKVNKRLIGTTNFSMTYDTTKNGYVLNGLHNVFRQSSHDRFGNKTSNGGETVVYLKKEAENNRDPTQYSNTAFNRIRTLINTPMTRDMGIAIVNFGYETCIREKTLNTGNKNEQLQRFGEYFNNDIERNEAWDKSIWGRLGFKYNQIGNHNKFDTQDIYNKHNDIPEYGFTTNTPIDVSMIPTISTLNNPLQYVPTDPTGTAGDKVQGTQFSNTNNFARPFFRYGSADFNMYADSLLTTCVMVPVVIDDVGGVIGENLPILSKHGYYLITSDILDNYKDNVKKGDVLPLLGVVPKSSESNQDYIVSNNQIIQVLSQDKVVNRLKIKILNPDLTNPNLSKNSSVILKLTLPNITPAPLLPPKVVKQLMGETQTF